MFVKDAAQDARREIRRPRAVDARGAGHAAGRGPQDREPGDDPRVPEHENICVDIHVHRISNRLGWVQTRTPEETEQALYATIRQRWWPVINLYLVTWGQNICRPVYPRCDECAIRRDCQFRLR